MTGKAVGGSSPSHLLVGRSSSFWAVQFLLPEKISNVRQSYGDQGNLWLAVMANVAVRKALRLDGKSDQLPSSQGKGDEVDRTGLAVTDSDGSQLSCNMH